MLAFFWLLLPWLALGLFSLHTSMASCPSNCSCYDWNTLLTVNCTRSQLDRVPTEVPRNTQVLVLHGNVISDLHGIIPGLHQLHRLDASDNRVSLLGRRGFVFQYLGLLTHLNLAKNRLDAIHKDAFHGLISLESLVLSQNRISYIENQAFQPLFHLRQLDLSYNKLSALDVEWFARLANLNMLNVAANHVHHLNAALQPLTRLETLHLHNNRIDEITNDAFVGLTNLRELRLDGNELFRVPTLSLRPLVSLDVLQLSNNQLTILGPADLAHIPVRQLHLSRMPMLQVVGSGAFTNLSRLHTLALHDNPRLVFLDPASLVNVSHLQVLLLHNNQLQALPRALAEVLPSGCQISLTGNPLRCDCNVRWLRLELTSVNTTRFNFSGASRLQCATPQNLTGKLIKDLYTQRILKECGPTILPTFSKSVERRLGDSTTLDCRALGIPRPKLTWTLPDGQPLNRTFNTVRVRLRPPATLVFDHLKENDSGVYTCSATNVLGYTNASVELRVHRIDIQLFPMSVTSTFVDLVWNGSARNTFPKYILMYRLDQEDADVQYEHVPVSPILRSYTVNNLTPETTYEFCIAFEDKDGHYVQIACTKARTQDAAFMLQGIQRTSNIAVAVVFGIVVAMLGVVCVATLAARRHRHSQYENPDQSLVTTMSQIPLENLYSPLMSNIGS